jgi:hypothetical protein
MKYDDNYENYDDLTRIIMNFNANYKIMHTCNDFISTGVPMMSS